jgi:hypothetical protein
MEEKEAVRQDALDLLLETGVLEECKDHEGTYYDGSGDLEAAYKAANAKVTKGELSLPGNMGRRDFTDVVKAVYEDNSGLESCPTCDKNFGPD